jgi:hypothetical protein
MDWQLTASERTYLRELARRQGGYAALPIMEQRKRMWYDLNDARPGAKPPVIIETWTFDRDFLPDSLLQCTSKTGRSIEKGLLRNIRNHELIDDDKVIPSTYDVGFFLEIDDLGVEVRSESVKDSQGVATGYRFLHPIKDLKSDLHILKPASYRVDREKSAAWKTFAEELLGDLLPIRQTGRVPGFTFLTSRVIQLMGMQAYFMAMYDAPDELHKLMGVLRDNVLGAMRWAEREGLLRLNNANDDAFGSSTTFSTRLPAPGYAPPAARLCDMWGATNSQETVGVSPALFHEFCFPYYKAVVEPLGLLYYGCCEPVHSLWDDIRQLPHLKKVSISRWCDQRFMGEALRGTEIVYSRKPDPNLFCIEAALDEEAWSAHIRETLEAARGVFMEIIVRDVYTMQGNLAKPKRAVELARQEIDRYHQ